MRSRTIMNCNNQTRSCHAERMSQSPERSEGEGSLCPSRQALRCAQGDNTLPILVVKTHYRARGERRNEWNDLTGCQSPSVTSDFALQRARLVFYSTTPWPINTSSLLNAPRAQW